MSDPFERANNSVTNESGLYLEVAATIAELPTAAPSTATDGGALNGAARCVVAVAGGAALTAQIWFYVVVGAETIGWRRANNGSLTIDAVGGVVERLNCAGFTRVYVQGSASGSGGAHILRSIT